MMTSIHARLAAAALFLGCILAPITTQAQVRDRIEPPEVPSPPARTAYGEGLRTGWLARVNLSDNGIAVGTELRKVLAPYTDLMINLEVGGLRDSREQVFTSYFGQVTPNKYNRVVSAPLMVGIRQRLFASAFDDNFRLNFSVHAGPAAAFVYPYFDDKNNNGIRDSDTLDPSFYEMYYDVFRGWNDGDFMFGGSGRVSLGIDFGDRFRRVTSFEFGYQFSYYGEGIQIMQPFQYEIIQTPEGLGLIEVPGASKQKFFGTPVITLSFGRFW